MTYTILAAAAAIMPDPAMSDSSSERPGLITRYLRDWREGDAAALDRLTTEVYSELRNMAASVLSDQSRDRTLQPTALVHELYMKLPAVRHFDWRSRAQFLGVAAKMMRNILVSHARERLAAKRGGGAIFVAEADPQQQDRSLHIDVLTVHQALERFAGQYPRQSWVVELRFFGGLTAEET